MTETMTPANPMDAVEAQRLIIRIFMQLNPYESAEMLTRLNAEENQSAPMNGEYLMLCSGFGSELREEPDRYSRVDKICTAILRRQNRGDSISKKDYGEALGLTNRMQRLRVEKGEVALDLHHITRICAGFDRPADRRFWENQLLEMYPGASSAGRDCAVEIQSLRWLCAFLRSINRYQAVADRLDALDRQRLRDLLSDQTEAAAGRFTDNSGGLYATIAALADSQHILIPDLAEEEIGVQLNTWYAWRKSWMQAEKIRFREGIPRNRLKRTHVMLLAVIFKLNYLESIYLMALAGYRFVAGEPDKEVVRYLLGQADPMRPDEIKSYLREGIYTGRW